MRQGETAPKGGWIGNATGGVKAPEPILLPDPAVRFARTAERLERLSEGHPMEGWLDFMAKLARAQHRVATMLPPGAAPDEADGGAGGRRSHSADLRRWTSARPGVA